MDVSIIVQTCDKYEKYWSGFFYYMDRFWDKNINCPIYFCNENKKISNKNYIHLPTGSGSFVNNLNFILDKIETKYIFYLLEDFWPINNFNKILFDDIYNYIILNEAKIFQISPCVPFYDLNSTNDILHNQKILKFSKSSLWRFNFQSRFWDKDFLKSCLLEPSISESKVNSAITVEMECDKHMDKNIDIYFYHYFWYPLSGVSYRGEYTNFGLELFNNMMVDLYGKNLSS